MFKKCWVRFQFFCYWIMDYYHLIYENEYFFLQKHFLSLSGVVTAFYTEFKHEHFLSLRIITTHAVYFKVKTTRTNLRAILSQKNNISYWRNWQRIDSMTKIIWIREYYVHLLYWSNFFPKLKLINLNTIFALNRNFLASVLKNFL